MRAHTEAVGYGFEVLLLFVDAVTRAPPPCLVHERAVRRIHEADDAVIDADRHFSLQVGQLVLARELLDFRGRIGRFGRTTGWAEWQFASEYGATEVDLTLWSEPGIRWDAFKESLGARRWLKRQANGSLRRLRAVFEERPDRPLERATIAGYEPLKAARFGA